MRGLTLGQGLSRGKAGLAASYTVTITGLTSGEARPGDHASIGFTTDPVGGTITQKWGSTLGGSEYGTGSAPTDYTAGDGGTLYLEVTRDGEVVRASAPILYAAPAFSVQPTITGTLAVGETLTLTEGTASPAATLAITTFTLDGVDKSGELVGLDWDTTGENVYDLDPGGEIIYRVSATNSGGTTLSNVITATLTDVPDTMDAPSVSAVSSSSISVTRGLAPDDGNATITSYDLRWSDDEATWTTVTGIANPETVGSLSASTLYYVQTRAVNATGNGAWSASGTATTEASVAVNPVFTLGTQTAGSGGSPDSVSVSSYSYAGADTLDLYAVTSNSATPPSKAEIEAVSGTSVEGDTILAYSGSAVSLDGFTDDTVSHLHAFLKERNNGGESAITTVALTDIDFTPLGFTSAEATDANTVVVTLNDTVLPTTGNTGTWAFNIAGSPATVTGAVVSGSTVTLTVSDTMTDADTLNALAYTPGNLTDERGNAMVAFSGQSITNSIAASAPVVTYLTGAATTFTSTTSYTASALDTSGHSGTDDLFIGIFNLGSGLPDSITLGGHTATLVTSSDITSGGYYAAWYRITGQTLGATSDLVYNDSGAVDGIGYAIYSVSNVTTVTPDAQTAGAASITATLNVANDDALLALTFTKATGSGGLITFSGLTKDVNQSIGVRPFAAGSIDGLTANAAYDVVATYDGSNSAGLTILQIA